MPGTRTGGEEMNVQLHPYRCKFILRWCPIPIRTEAMRAELDVLIEQEKSARVAELEAALAAAVDSMVNQKPLGTREQVLKQARALLAQEPA